MILRQKTNILLIILLVLVLMLMQVGCGQGTSSNSSNNGGSQSESSFAQAVTINNAGVIPVFKDTSTTTVIYIHNNSNQLISGVKYTVSRTNFSSNGLDDLIKLDSKSSNFCSNIGAGQSCPLMITTPIMHGIGFDGASFLNLDYTLNDGNHQFTQLINYKTISNNETKGAQFSSGVSISSFGNKTGYATLYLYGTGVDSIYTVSSIKSNIAGVTVTQGNITGKQIQSNFVQAVELSGVVEKTEYYADISVVSSIDMSNQAANFTNTDQVFTSNVSVGVVATTNGPILISSVSPIVNTSLTQKGTLYILNSGNATAVVNNIAPSNGITLSTGVNECSVGGKLAIGAGCIIYFDVPIGSGNGTLTITYNNLLGNASTNLTQNITWFNASSPVLGMVAANDPLNFTGINSESNVITVTNLGMYTVSNVTPIAPTATGGISTSILDTGTCNSVVLAPGESCSYSVLLSGASNTNIKGSVLTGITASYVNNGVTLDYSRSLSFEYNVYGYFANLSITPNPVLLTVVGNNTSVTIESVVVTNIGAASAKIIGSILDGNPSYLNIINNGCVNGVVLNANESCVISIQLGAVNSSDIITESATVSISYNGGVNTTNIITGQVNYMINPPNISLFLNNITPPSAPCYITGTQPSSYQLNGGQCNNGNNIVLQYINNGDSNITITGIEQSNSGNIWQLNQSSTTCMVNSGNNLGNVVLRPNNTCIVQFDYVLPLYASSLLAVGATYDVSLTLPKFILRYGVTQYEVQPLTASSNNSINVISNQATVTNTTPSFESSSKTVTIAQTMTNALYSGTILLLSSITTNIVMEDYFTNVSSKECSTSSANGVMNQSCNFSANGTKTNTYVLNPAYINQNMHIAYNSNLNNQLVVFNTNNAVLLLQ